MRNVLSTVPKGAQEMVASIIRTVFAQPDAGHVHTQFDEVARMLGSPTRRSPRCSTMPVKTFSLSAGSHRSIGVRSGPRTRWSR